MNYGGLFLPEFAQNSPRSHKKYFDPWSQNHLNGKKGVKINVEGKIFGNGVCQRCVKRVCICSLPMKRVAFQNEYRGHNFALIRQKKENCYIGVTG